MSPKIRSLQGYMKPLIVKPNIEALLDRASNQTKNKYYLCKDIWGEYYDNWLFRQLEDLRHNFNGWTRAILNELHENKEYRVSYLHLIHTIYQSSFRNYCKLIIEKNTKSLGFTFEHQALIIQRLKQDIERTISRYTKKSFYDKHASQKEYLKIKKNVKKMAKTTCRRINQQYKGLYNKTELKIIELYCCGVKTDSICKAFNISRGELYRILQRSTVVFELLNILKKGTSNHDIYNHKELFQKRLERVSTAYGIVRIFYRFRRINKEFLTKLKTIAATSRTATWHYLGVKIAFLIKDILMLEDWKDYKRKRNLTNNKHLSKRWKVNTDKIKKIAKWWNNTFEEIAYQIGIIGLLNGQV